MMPAIRVSREMTHGKMRVSPLHRRSFPAAEFLQDMERRSVLHVPARPAMAALAGRLYVGIELEEMYCVLARRRLGRVERFMQRRLQRLISHPTSRALGPNS